MGVCVDSKFKEPAQQLFLWCVLMHFKDLAMCFWEEGTVSSCCCVCLSNTHTATWSVVVSCQSVCTHATVHGADYLIATSCILLTECCMVITHI